MVNEPEGDGLELFYILWSLAIFFHFEWSYLRAPYPATFTQLVIIVTTPLVIATLRREAFLAMIAAQLIDCYQHQPRCPNHWQLVAFVNITYLLADGCRLVTNIPLATIFREAITPLTIAFYAFTAFWKLTVDFLNPTTSCSVKFLTEIPTFGSLIPEKLLLIIPALTILTEALVGVLLATRKYRSALITGLSFHFALTLNMTRKFANFSAVMYALLIASCCSNPLYSKSLLSKPINRKLLAIQLPIILIWTTSSALPGVVYSTMRFGILALMAAYLFYLTLSHKEDFIGPPLSRLPAPVRIVSIFPTALLVIVGIFPLLGIRNGSAWQMYSNLILTAQESNHLLIPRSFNILGIQGEEVEITYYSTLYFFDIVKIPKIYQL
jgi:hypothetical protein